MCRLSALKIVPQTNKINTATVVFLHGSGDTGPGILDWIKFLVDDIKFPHIKFIFPTAPLRPYTPLNGEKSHVWFDRLDISPKVPEHKETLDSIGEEMKTLIEKEVSAGVQLNRIVVGGFSMGGALGLHTAFRFTPGLGGVFALSSFLNHNSAVYESLKTSKTGVETPLYMCHGERDSLVPIDWGRETFKNLVDLGVNGEFIPLKHTLHELKKHEIVGLFEWLLKILPEKVE